MSPAFEWEGVRAAVNYLESDSLAIIRGRDDSLSWLPVYIRESDSEFFIGVEEWHALNALPAHAGQFERFEKVRRKKLYDTARNKMVVV